MESAAAGERTAADYGTLLRRRWLWIVVGVVVGLGFALAYLFLVTPTYQSTAKVLVNAVSTDVTAVSSRTPAGSVNLDTEAQLVMSFPVASRAGEILGTSAVVPLISHVSVAVPPNSTVLAITYSSSTAKQAQAGAEAFAKAYIVNRNSTAQATVNGEVARLNGVVKQLGQQLLTINHKLIQSRRGGNDNGSATLLSQRYEVSAQISAASAALGTLRTTTLNGGAIIYHAQLPHNHVAPEPLLVIPSGLVAGLMLGLLLAVLHDRMDRRSQLGSIRTST